MTVETVNYNVLDAAKLKFINASKKTLRFAEKFGFVPEEKLGGSANIFALDLQKFVGNKNLFLSLVPEGLGTADDAKPDDLSPAELEEFWRNIAFKCLSALTNDACASGLQSILVGLYLPSATPEEVFDKPFLEGFLGGFVEGCKQVGCVYLSGETPQLKTKMVPGRLDIAGSVCALCPPGLDAVDGGGLSEGDTIVFLGSSGPHENGFTTLRAFAEKLPQGYRTKLPSGTELWRAMNAPSVLYTPLIQAARTQGITFSALEHVTGHGWQKLMRSSKSVTYRIKETLPVLEVFEFFELTSGITRKQLASIFNCGVGFACYLPKHDDAKKLVSLAEQFGIKSCISGVVEAGSTRSVIIEPWNVTLSDAEFVLKRG